MNSEKSSTDSRKDSGMSPISIPSILRPIHRSDEYRSEYKISDESKLIQYLIAAAAIGMCLSNMFIMKNKFQNLNMPFSNTTSKTRYQSSAKQSSDHTYTNSSDRSKYHNYTRKAWEEELNQIKRESEPTLMNIYPPKVVSALDKLELSPLVTRANTTGIKFNKDEIKSAFHILALKYHPDVLPVHDKRRILYEGKFKEIQNAYTELQDYLR